MSSSAIVVDPVDELNKLLSRKTEINAILQRITGPKVVSKDTDDIIDADSMRSNMLKEAVRP